MKFIPHLPTANGQRPTASTEAFRVSPELSTVAKALAEGLAEALAQVGCKLRLVPRPPKLQRRWTGTGTNKKMT